MGPATRLAYAKLLMQLASWSLGLSNSASAPSPALSWDEAIVTVLHMGEDPETLDDAAASFGNDCVWAGEHRSISNRLNNAIAWAMPKFSRWGTDPLPRGKQATAAAARRASTSTRMPLPELLLAGIVMTMAWLSKSTGRRIDRAVAAWTGARAYL